VEQKFAPQDVGPGAQAHVRQGKTALLPKPASKKYREVFFASSNQEN